jgi:hypothetical protein
VCLLARSVVSEDWQRVDNKDEIRGSSMTAFDIEGSMADTSFGVIC